MASTTCRICHSDVGEWGYMPFFSDGAHFTTPAHAREIGATFLVICDACKRAIEGGERREFTLQRTHYVVNDVWLSGLESVYFVRPEGNLDPGSTHILIADEPDWDVMLCGTAICDDEQVRLGTSGSFSLVVADLCLTCLDDFVMQLRRQQEDKRLHRVRAVPHAKK